MKLNLGCGPDVREGYVNVDLHDHWAPGVIEKKDLSTFPWPWPNESVEEIMMLDFLEHFPRSQTETVLLECWRILKEGGNLVIQVPDFEHCSRAVNMEPPFLCNQCGWEFTKLSMLRTDFFLCGNCRQPAEKIAQAGIARLYGGQDFPGNWHFTAFSKFWFPKKLMKMGFAAPEFLEEQHQYKNWNFKLSAKKSSLSWET